MTLVDANLLLYATDETSPFHEQALSWLGDQLNGPHRVGLPWLAIGAFLRLSMHPVRPRPLTPVEAWGQVQEWLGHGGAWTPTPGPAYPRILGAIFARHSLTPNLVTDAQLAALAIEHGLTICSTDTDFARFTEARWENPIAPQP